MGKYEFSGSGELTEKAFQVYSNSSFTFWKEGDTFYYSDNPSSEKVELGSREKAAENGCLFCVKLTVMLMLAA